MILKCIAGYVLACLLAGCQPEQRTIQPGFKIVTEAVYASGTLVAEREYKVVPAIDGYLVSSMVSEGDSVQAGKLLYTVRSASLQVQEQSARDILRRTMPVVKKDAPAFNALHEQIGMLTRQLQNDSLQYSRYRNLYEKQAISKSQLEKRQLQYQRSLTDLNKLKQQLRSEHLNADIRYQSARNQVQVSKTVSNEGLLRSAVNGIVYEVYKQQGDIVNRNQPVALIGSSKMIARLLVDEDDLARVSPGHEAIITMDAFPGKYFEGKVTKVYPFLSRIEQSFRVDVEFNEALPVNIYGLNVEANIVINRHKKVMVIPKKAVRGDSVLVRNGTRSTMVKITGGIEDNEWMEVKSGLDISSQIIYEP